MTDNGAFNAVLAMTDIDDSLVSEAAEPKKQKGFFSIYLPIAAAAAAAIALVVMVFHFLKKPSDKSAVLPPAVTAEATDDTAASSTEAYSEATGEPVFTEPGTYPPAETSEPSAQATLLIPSETVFITALPTVFTTSMPTAAPSYSSMPTGAPTPAVTYAPTPSPTTEHTAAPTGEPTPGPTLQPTSAPTIVPTAAPTYGPTAEPSAPVGTSAPTSEPSAEPTGLPPETQMQFYSFEAFVQAVSGGNYPLLNGIEYYFTADNVLAAAALQYIYVDEQMVKYIYMLPYQTDGEFAVICYRDRTESSYLYNSLITNHPDGTWHGDTYFYLTPAGNYFGLRMFDERLIMTRCSANVCTEEQAVSYSMLTIHYI